MTQKFERAAKHYRLTPREIETAKILASGFCWKAVADEMHISIHTVRFHVRNLCNKIGAENSLAAIFRLLT